MQLAQQIKTGEAIIQGKQPVPTWILVVSGFFALLELMVSILLCFSPQSVLERVDLTVRGVDYLVYTWAARQFALAFIFGVATFRRSRPMLTTAYIFFLVMFAGDAVIGFYQKDYFLASGGLVMCFISLVLLFAL